MEDFYKSWGEWQTSSTGFVIIFLIQLSFWKSHIKMFYKIKPTFCTFTSSELKSALQEQSLITLTSDSPIVQTEVRAERHVTARCSFSPVRPGSVPAALRVRIKYKPRPNGTFVWTCGVLVKSSGSTVRLLTFTRSEVIRKISTVAAVFYDDYAISIFIFIWICWYSSENSFRF